MAAKITGGKKLRARLQQIAKQVNHKTTVKVGFMGGATYPDGTSVAQVAFWNEYGTTHKDPDGNVMWETPARPFFRRMISAKSPGWGVSLGRQIVNSGFNLQVGMGRMGEIIIGQLAESITEFNAPALAASTIAAKGFDKPLVDTGHMLNSITYKVE